MEQASSPVGLKRNRGDAKGEYDSSDEDFLLPC
jgi:hypothetical protein